MTLHINEGGVADQRALEIDRYTVRLWDVDIVTGGQALRIETQLAIHPALIVLLNGDGVLKREAASIRMKPDTLYVAPADTTFGIEGGTAGESAVAVIRYGLFRESGSGGSELAAEDTSGLDVSVDGVALSASGRLSGLCRMMKEQNGSDDALTRWRAQLTLQELLYEAFTAARRRPKADSRDALELAKAYMEEHYNEELTIERLAGIADLSPKYFVDLFKKRFGVSALDHLTHVRMSKAKRLMLCSAMRLKDIAHEVGFEDEFYFSRKFRKSVGLSPTAFIKKRRNRLAVYGSSALLGYLMPLQVVPYAAPMHPKWSSYYYGLIGSDIAVHLDAYRHNHHKAANLDKLAAAGPELILCPSGLDDMERIRLSEIAELYELPDEDGWRNGLLALAEKLDEQAEARRWIEAYDLKASFAKESISVVSRHRQPVVLTVRMLEGQLFAHCNRGMSDVLFNTLGASFPFADGVSPYDRPITLEEIDAADADMIWLLIRQESDTLTGWKALRQSPQWLGLRAVREGRMKFISSEPWREYSPSALDRMLDDAQSLLTGKRP